MEDNKKFMIIAIPSGFIVFIMVISIMTGSNPIDSLFMLIGQTVMYLGMLFLFGAPIFMLIALISVLGNEIMQAKAAKEEDRPKRKLFGGGKKKKARQPEKLRRTAGKPKTAAANPSSKK